MLKEAFKRIFQNRENGMYYSEEESNLIDCVETNFVYENDTREVYYRTKDSDIPMKYLSQKGNKYRFDAGTNQIIETRT